MGRFAYITTPIPTLEEVGKSLKISKTRQRRLIEIVTGSAPPHLSVVHRAVVGSANGRLSNRNGASKLSSSRTAAKVSAPSKKSTRAATAS
jgi:hypothetical protein